MKKFVALVLCVITIMIALSSCAKNSGDTLETPGAYDTTEQNGETNTPEHNDEPNMPAATQSIPQSLVERAYEDAFATFPPDTVMIRTSGLDVTWAELFVFMRSIVGSLSDYFGDDPIDWSAPWDDEISCADWALQTAIEEALVNVALAYGAEQYGVALSEDDWALIRGECHSLIAEWGGEEVFLDMLWERRGYSSLVLFEDMMSFSRLGELLFNEVFGQELELLTDDEIAEFIANDGLMMVKHIFLVKPENGGSINALDSIENIMSQLKAYRGEDFEACFDEMMNTYSEDVGGLEYFPHGYLFMYGDMTPYFYEAVASLEINELSGIVEGEGGYHIMYRIPINYDVTPFTFANQDDYRSLRTLVANAKFGILHDSWLDMQVLEFTDEFKSISIPELFKRA